MMTKESVQQPGSEPMANSKENRPGKSVATVRDWAPILIVVFCGLLGVLPILLRGVPYHYDLGNHYHFALPFYEAVRSGTVYPSWLTESNYGFGDPSVRFYPPAFYYLLSATRALIGNWYVASLVSFAIVSVLGSLGAYFWARSFVPQRIAIAAGFLYAFMPYHVAELYQSAQLAEYMAGAALLFAFAFLKRICDEGRRHHVAGLAAAYALLILSHLPLAVIGSLALLLYGLCCLNWKRVGVTLVKLTLGVGLGLGGSAFYWGRMMTELGWIVGDGTPPDPLLDYRVNFVFSTFSPEKNLSIWWMNILMIATLVMLLPCVVLLRKSCAELSRRSVIAVLAVTVFSIAMATPISRPLWDLFLPLQKTQHPFRWIAVLSTSVPILIATSLPFWIQQARGRGRAFALLAAGALAIPLTFTVFQTIRDANYLSRAEFEQMLQPLLSSPAINAWLTIWARNSHSGGGADDKCVPPPEPHSLVEADGRSVTVELWERERRKFSVQAGNPTLARARTFYYPHWKATAAGRELSTQSDSNGALLISLPAEATSVELTFREPQRSLVAAAVSALNCVLICAIAAPLGRRKKAS